MSEETNMIESRLVMELMVKLIKGMSHEDTIMNMELSESLMDVANKIGLILNAQLPINQDGQGAIE